MYFDNLAKLAHRMAKPIVKIPPQAYAPLPKQMQLLSDLIEENI